METGEQNGVTHVEVDVEVVNEGVEDLPDVLRFEVTLERQVIVYAHDIEGASAKALQVDGVAGRYKVVECVVVGPSGMDPREPMIDRAPSRETQK
jgi:hypothetical protein